MLRICIDPGKWDAGLAVGWGPTLLHASTVSIPEKDRRRWVSGFRPPWWPLVPMTVTEVKLALVHHPYVPTKQTRVKLVMERPQDYPGKRARSEDLATLRNYNHRVRDCIEDLVHQNEGVLVTQAYRASQWKGNVKKPIHHRRLAAVLREAERALVRGDHNAWDAVGLFLFDCERTGRGGVLPDV